MLPLRPPKLSYANVTATVALIVAMGGGAYAATQLPKNSVGSDQIQKRAVTTPKLANGAVRGGKVANDALTGKQIKESTLKIVPNAGKLGGLAASEFARGQSFVGRVTFTTNSDPGGKKIADVPGLGRLEVQDCNNGSLVFGPQWHITSSRSEDLVYVDEYQGPGAQNAQSGPTYKSVAKGDTVPLVASDQGPTFVSLQVGAGTGNAKRVASALVSTAYVLASNSCVFHAQGVLQAAP